MKPEQRMWAQARDLFYGLDPVRVENAATPGTPDVNYCEGWVELKQLKAWPKKRGTPVKVRLFTPQQRAWLRRRYVVGGRVHVLLKVGREWLLLNGMHAATALGAVTEWELKHHARGCWQNKPEPEDFQRCLLDDTARQRTPR